MHSLSSTRGRPTTWWGQWTRWAVPALTVLILYSGCGSKGPGANNDGSIGTDTPIGGDTGSPPDATSSDVPHTTCGTFGQACVNGGGCCSGICGPNSTCEANPVACTPAGSSCAANSDCCTTSCVNGFCADRQCTSDGKSCTSAGACCSGTCTAGKCAALNPACSTVGNACTSGVACCSKLCKSGHCANPSFCVQSGDACSQGSECCSGTCTVASGHTVGTCGAIPTGSTYCSQGVDGVLCDDCTGCCSRLCAPYGPTGVKVCQPAQGCRVNGDLCRKTEDCCGGGNSGLPGDGNVTCQKANPNDEIGICRNPMSCNPEGNVCHFLNYACGSSSARNDCCGAVGNSGVCKLDSLGVPRCYGLGDQCRMPGQSCAYSGDCCNNVPCVPNAQGQLTCAQPGPDGGPACIPSGGNCTTTADCCVGTTCVIPVGSDSGKCETVGPPPADGGIPSADGGSDGGAPPPVCAQFGQACSSSQPCCSLLTCYENNTNPQQPCPAGSTNCACSILRPQG
jgi:hypothetical protein